MRLNVKTHNRLGVKDKSFNLVKRGVTNQQTYLNKIENKAQLCPHFHQDHFPTPSSQGDKK